MQCGLVSVDEHEGAAFAMYPNPTTGELHLQLPAVVRGAVDLRVADLAGRTVHQEVLHSSGSIQSIDLGKLQSGNYVVTITTNDWVKSQQLQVIR